MKKAVFLDRDGVINKMVFHSEFGTVDSPANVEEFVLCSGVGEAVATFNALGLLVIIVSNQPGIAKGKFTKSLLEAMEKKMLQAIGKANAKIDAIYYCLHHPESKLEEYRVNCECRKPKPGMLLKAAQDWQIDLSKSYFIGDGVTDILAGQKAQTINLFLSNRKCYICDSLIEHNALPDYIVENIGDAAFLITNLEEGKEKPATKFIFSCK